MNIGYEQTTKQIQTTKLVMTQKLLHSIKILECSTKELKEEIESELISNALLMRDSSSKKQGNDNTTVSINDQISKASKDFEWNQYSIDNGTSTKKPRKNNDLSSDKISFLDNQPGREKNLQEYLLSQIRLNFDFEIDQKIATLIIENINTNGFLELINEDFSVFDYIVNKINRDYGDEKIDKEDVQDILYEIQRNFDPVGCGTENSIDSLAIQAEVQGFSDIEVKIIKDDFKNMAERRFQQIKDKYNIKDTDIIEFYEKIQSLEPHPARNFFPSEPVYIEPDVIIRKIDDKFIVIENRPSWSRIKIRKDYENILKTDSFSGKNGKQDKEFIENQLSKANMLISSIDQRTSTIKKIAEAILHFQESFFENGCDPYYLEPIILKDIAEYVNLDESTVSRSTSNKYILTDFKIIPFKDFFSSGVSTKEGDSISTKKVKEVIKIIVKGEDINKPLSDEKIMEILNSEYGINGLTRRTVANYRKELGIPSSSKRKDISSFL
ncbi:RNA polymerase factor sigma-54 [bacterium]|nr:RNA polymerase factor sigma-54 [bacterium]